MCLDNDQPAEEMIVIDDTDNDNPLDGLIVREADVRRFFEYLKAHYAVLHFAVRVSQIMCDLKMSFVEVNSCFNIVCDVQSSHPELLDEHWYHLGLFDKRQRNAVIFHYDKNLTWRQYRERKAKQQPQ